MPFIYYFISPQSAFGPSRGSAKTDGRMYITMTNDDTLMTLGIKLYPLF